MIFHVRNDRKRCPTLTRVRVGSGGYVASGLMDLKCRETDKNDRDGRKPVNIFFATACIQF